MHYNRLNVCYSHQIAVAQFIKLSCFAQDDRIEQDELSELLAGWYRTVFTCGTLAPILQFLRLPFQPVHCETYRLLSAIAKLPWGVKLQASSAGDALYWWRSEFRDLITLW